MPNFTITQMVTFTYKYKPTDWFKFVRKLAIKMLVYNKIFDSFND